MPVYKKQKQQLRPSLAIFFYSNFLCLTFNNTFCLTLNYIFSRTLKITFSALI